MPAAFRRRRSIQPAHQPALPGADSLHAPGLRSCRPDGRQDDLAIYHRRTRFGASNAVGTRHDPQPFAGSRKPASRCADRAAHPDTDDGDRFQRGGAGDARFRFRPYGDGQPGNRGDFRRPMDPGIPARRVHAPFLDRDSGHRGGVAAGYARLAQSARNPEEHGDRHLGDGIGA